MKIETTSNQALMWIADMRETLPYQYTLELVVHFDELHVFLCDGLGRTYDPPMSASQFVYLMESSVDALMPYLSDNGKILHFIKLYKGIGSA